VASVEMAIAEVASVEVARVKAVSLKVAIVEVVRTEKTGAEVPIWTSPLVWKWTVGK
jgi:hypothetical protein